MPVSLGCSALLAATATATVERIFIRHKFCDLAKCAPRTWPGNLWLAKQAEGKQRGGVSMQKTALALNYTHVGRESSSREGGGKAKVGGGS